MKFTVIWKPTAEQALADIWINSLDRPAVTQAANYIEKALKTDPQNKGESRNDNYRILLESPLGIDFQVDLMDRKVTVLTV